MKMVVMAGGQGTRFWPLSRKNRPKQFLNVIGEKTLFQLTVERLKNFGGVENIFVVCSEPYVPLVLSQAPELDKSQVIVEAAPRNTAPCIGLAAAFLDSRFPGETMGIFPSDHLITDEVEFRSALNAADKLAASGQLVTFGIIPEFPATGYGYLEKGAEVAAGAGRKAFKVARFTEKPGLETAEEFLASGRYFWNSGMFVWSIKTILSEIRCHMPGLGRILDDLGDCLFSAEDEKSRFESAQSVSIDYGVMEKSEKVVMVPCSPGWNDVGDWNAVAEIMKEREDGFENPGPSVVRVNSSNCFVHSESGKKIALAGVEDLILVETEDSILVCSKKKSQDVAKIVQELKEKNPELT